MVSCMSGSPRRPVPWPPWFPARTSGGAGAASVPSGPRGPSVPSAQSWYAWTGRISTPNPGVGQGTLSGRKNSHPGGALAYLCASASLSHRPATAMLATAAPNARMAAAPPRLHACHPMDSHPVAASKPWIAAWRSNAAAISGTDAGLLDTHGWAAIAARHASGHAPSRTVTQSSSFLSSKNPSTHRFRKSTGRMLAASPTLRRVAKEMTARPRQNQSRVVLMLRAMSRRVTSSAHTWVGRGAAVVVAAPRAMSQCTGRTVGRMHPSFSARRRADMTPRSVPGCWPMAARRTRYWDSAPAASSSGQCAANRPTSLRIAVHRSTVPGDHRRMASARGSSM